MAVATSGVQFTEALSTRVEAITPERAHELLANNTHNRNVRQRRVSQLAGAMLRGEWVLNGEPIQIAADGTILNGQHRLLAIIESGVTVAILMVYGLDRAAQETIDIGAARTIGDMLRARGYADANNIAAAARLVFIYEEFGTLASWARIQATHQQVIAAAERNPDLAGGAPIARTITDGGLALPKSWGMALHYLMGREWDVLDAETFFIRLAYGDNLSATDSIYQLRDTLLRERVKHQGRRGPLVMSALTIKAFNAWVSGETLQTLRWRPGGKAKESFPLILKKDEAELAA